MPDLPLVSAIMPAYNAAAFIGQTLDSVRGQRYPNLEILVVDDGSNDGTVAIVEAAAREDTRIRLLRQANKGVAATRNRAIEEAKGTYIAPIDADDLWHPEKIACQVGCMEAGGPSVGLVSTWWSVIDESGEIAVAAGRPEYEGDVFETLLQTNFVGSASVPLFRRAALDRVGGYNTRMREQGGQGCEDWDMVLRIAEHYECRTVLEYLVAYRKVDRSMSSNCDAMARSYQGMIEPLRERHPELEDDLYRRSESGFHGYLAKTSYLDGNHREALRRLRRAWEQDWAVLSDWRLLLIGATSLPLAVAQPIVSRIWPRRQAWLRLRRAWGRLQRRPDVHFAVPSPRSADRAEREAPAAVRAVFQEAEDLI
ncbi:MAG: glycosyltransferase family 2 protein [Rhodothermales bacterium]